MTSARLGSAVALSIVTALAVQVAVPAAPAAARQLQAPGDWVWRLPAGVPTPVVPADNPMTEAKFILGRRLFHDRRLSGNGTFSCASCHQQSVAFADTRPRAIGSTGERHPRGAMMLGNVAYAAVLTWANPNERSLEHQALTPLFGEHPVEMGLAGREQEMLARLRADSAYPALFAAAFPERSGAITLESVTKAIATFERGLLSFDAPYDRARTRRNPAAMSDAARRGERLFFSERTECFHCHGGITFSGSVHFTGKASPDIEYHNNGLYGIGTPARYPEENSGLEEFTRRPKDNGMFKAPSLRNVALTAPYMHDGSLATLDDVVAHYARGGRRVTQGALAGDGRRHPARSPFVRGFTLSRQERRDLVAFLHSLTDSTLVHSERYADPFAVQGRAR
jgi:cytochrome c peroxidase